MHLLDTLSRKLKDPFKVEQRRSYPAYLSTSEDESVADKLKSSEHKQNGVTMPVLKNDVVDLLAGKNREPPSATTSQAYAKGLVFAAKEETRGQKPQVAVVGDGSKHGICRYSQ